MAGRCADEGFMDPGSGYLLEDEPALAAYHVRQRRLWYVAQFAPLVVLGVVAVAPVRTAVALTLTLVLPMLIWTLTSWAGVEARRRAGVAKPAHGRRSLMSRLARGYLTVCIWSVFVCYAGIWAAAVVIPLVVVCYLSARVKNASPLDLTRLPPLSRQILAATPGLDAMGVPNRPGCPDVFVHGKAIYVSHDILSGAESKLTMLVAREVAHLRLGHRRISPLPAVRMAAVTAMAWLVAVALGVLPLTYQLPLDGFGPAWSAVPSVVFGLTLALDLTAPFVHHRSRLRERDADGLALALFGDGVEYAWGLRSWAHENAEPLWPTRLHSLLAWLYPPTGERIERALAYGTRQPTPSLMPAGFARRDWIDDHRHAVVLGAWAWILVVGWILGKLHPGGMIH